MVLKAVEFLISDDSYCHINPKEIAILILSVVLHDIGMHTEFATFKAMIEGKYDNVKVGVIDEKKCRITSYNVCYTKLLRSLKVFDIKSDSERVKQYRTKWREDEYHFPGGFRFKNVIEWDKWMSDQGIRDSSGKYDLAQTSLACHFIKSFGFQLDTLNNPRIKDFDA